MVLPPPVSLLWLLPQVLITLVLILVVQVALTIGTPLVFQVGLFTSNNGAVNIHSSTQIPQQVITASSNGGIFL